MDSWPDLAVPDLPGQAPETLIWDTASRGMARAAAGPVATLYACGITPYDATHIGHAATFVAWDLLVSTTRCWSVRSATGRTGGSWLIARSRCSGPI